MSSLTLQFPLQWRGFVSQGLSSPWAALRGPGQHPVESGGKEESWETGRCGARKGALAKRMGLPDCLNSHWTEEQPSNLQKTRNIPKSEFLSVFIILIWFNPHFTFCFNIFSRILGFYSGHCQGLTSHRVNVSPYMDFSSIKIGSTFLSFLGNKIISCAIFSFFPFLRTCCNQWCTNDSLLR